MRLVHVELSSHSLHLVGLFFEILLVNGKLLSDLRTWLTCQQSLQLDVELFLLLNDDVLLDNLLSLLNKTLLKSLNLLEHLPSIRVSTLKLSPSVVVEWVLQLLGQSLDRKTLSQELLVKIDNLLAKLVNLLGLRLDNTELALQISN